MSNTTPEVADSKAVDVSMEAQLVAFFREQVEALEAEVARLLPYVDRAEKAEARVVLFERMQMPGTIARTVGKASSLTSVAIPITGNDAVTGSAEEKGK